MLRDSRAAFGCTVFSILCIWLVGCGGSPSVTTEAVTPPPPPAAKALLTDVAGSGELGSGAETIRQALEELKATDAAKAEGLLKELGEMEVMSDPNKIKAKAKAMADKL